MRRLISSLVLCLFLVLCFGTLCAQEEATQDTKDSFYITALDSRTDARLDQVRITFKQSEVTLHTNNNGLCKLKTHTLLPDSVLFEKEGYQSRQFYLDGQTKHSQVVLQQDYSNLQEVVVYGFNEGEALAKTAAAVHLIEAKEIQRGTLTNVAPLLNKIPGVFMQTGALNTNRITIRGVGGRSAFATRNIRAYYEDIPLTDSNGETAIEDIDLETIGSMEVIKGPTSSIYGAGTGGTIIMNAANTDLNHHSLSSKILIGSYGLQKANLTYRLSNDKISSWVQLNNLHSDGYRANNEFNRSSSTAFIKAYTKRNKTISGLVNRTNFEAFIPSSLSLEDALEDPRQAAFIWGNAEGFERYNETLIGLNYKGYGKHITSSHSISYRDKDSIEERPWDQINSDLANFQLRTVYSFATGPNSKLQIGFEWMREGLTSLIRRDNAFPSDSEIHARTRNLFLSFKTHIYENGTVEFGLNNNHLRIRDTQLTSGSFSSTIVTGNIPSTTAVRLALNTFSQNRKHNQYASFNTGLINPTSEQISANRIFNFFSSSTELESEKSRSIEVGGRGSFGKLVYDLVAYTMRIDNRIDQSSMSEDIFNNETEIIYDNKGSSEHAGIEASLTWSSKEFDGFFSKVSLSTAANYGSFLFGDYPEILNSDSGPINVNHKGNVLTGVPDLVANAEATFMFRPGVNLRLHYQHVGEQALNDENVTFSIPHDELNLMADYQKKISDSWSIDITAGIRNLLDADYYSMFSINAFGPPENARYYYPALPRNYFGSLKFTYHFKQEPT